MNASQWVGKTIDGRYVVDHVLGEGGMGVVLRAHHQFTGAVVAVKLIRPELQLSAEIQQRFLAEARAANAIGHAGIVQVLDAGRAADGSMYLVMELLEGRSLRTALYKEQLSTEEHRRILRELLEVLAVAHGKGFVHRDLKPDNVFLVGAARTVKLLDFGIAKMLGSTTGHALTATGMMMGTPAYMAPEQLRDASSVDARADLWAVGVIAYELLSGALPFHGTIDQMLVAIASRDPDPIRVHLGAAPPALDVFFTRALARDPRARFQTASEMGAAVAALELPASPGAHVAQPAMATPPASWAAGAPTPPASGAVPPHVSAAAAWSPAVGAAPTPAPPHVAGAAPTPTPPSVVDGAGPSPHAAWAPPTPPGAWAPGPSSGVPASPDVGSVAPRGPRGLKWIALVLALVALAGGVAFLVRRMGTSSKTSASTDPGPGPARDEGHAPAKPSAKDEECLRGCDAAAQCGLAPDDCIERCRVDAKVRACAVSAGNCHAAAPCFLALTCGERLPSGAGTCANALECMSNCPDGDIPCGCKCTVGARREDTLLIARIGTCLLNCRMNEECIAARCSEVVMSCMPASWQ